MFFLTRPLPKPQRVFVPVTTVLCAAALSGCGATTSPVMSPQLQTPTLYNPNDGRSGFSSAGGFGGSAGVGKTGSGITSPEEAAFAPPEVVQTPPQTFLAAPYVQKGDTGAAGSRTESLALLWQTPASAASQAQNWTVETRRAMGTSGGGAGRQAQNGWAKTDLKPTGRPFAGSGDTPAQTVWRTNLNGLVPGALFDYRVSLNDKPVFSARTRAPRPAGSPFRVVLWGDCAANTDAQKKIAYQASLSRPDFVCVTGDIVYNAGLASEYHRKFFPIYNAETASDETGAPLLRSTLFMASPGDHDMKGRDLGKTPDGMAYFAYWAQPLNGPELPSVGEADGNTPRFLGGDAKAEKAFGDAVAPSYPRMANFSYDYAGTHWTVLDSNPYADWSTGPLRAWLERDLASSSAQKASWRFVVFHHPPFSSSKSHQTEQQMRVVCDLMEKYKVAVVWSGHVHNYQRTFPMTFKAEKIIGNRTNTKDNKTTPGVWTADEARKSGYPVPGTWTLDKTFTGDKQTRPKGVVYVVTGAGGASLSDKDLEATPSAWEPFTRKYIASTHSFTEMNVSPQSLTVRQISEDGKELDKWTITQ